MSQPPPVRISKQTGFGHGAVQDFDTTPVQLGTASSCAVRFDPMLNPNVAPHHAQLAWNGQEWFLLDGGSPSGIWVDGRRVSAAVPVRGALSFSLGQDGPRLVASLLMAQPAPPPPVQAPDDARHRRNLIIALAVLLGMLLCAAVFYSSAFVAWRTWRSWQKPDADRTRAPFSFSVLEDEAADAPQQPPAASTSIFRPPIIKPGAKPQREEPARSESLYLSSMLAYQPVGGGYFWGGTFQHSPPPADAPVDLLLPSQFGPSMFLADLGRLQQLTSASPSESAPLSISPEDYSRILDELLGPDNVQSFLADLPRSSGDNSRAARNGGGYSRARSAMTSAMRSGARDSSAAPPKVWCVSVGIDDYLPQGPGGPDLAGCRNDAAAMAKLLLFQGLLDVEHLAVLTDNKTGDRYPSANNIRAALRRALQGAAPQDLVIFYFSGHGMHDPQSGETFFVPPDIDETQLAETALLGSQLQSLVASSSASKILMIFDSCQSGGLQVLGRARNADKLRGGPDPKLLESLAQATGHVAVRAAGKDEYSIAEPRLGHSVFTFVTLKGLAGDADRDKDGIVTLSELRPYVSSETPKLAVDLGHDAFHPSFTSGGQAGESGDIPLSFVPQNAPLGGAQ